MNRNEKSQEIEALRDSLKKSNMSILAEYQGLNVASIAKLRGDIRKSNASAKVYKNTLAKKAVEGTTHAQLSDYLVGQNLILVSETDPVTPAKVLVKFAEENDKLKLKAGILDGKLLDFQAIVALSKLPSREELLAKLLGSMLAPAQNLVNVLAAVPRQLVTVLAAIRDTKQ